MLIKSILYKKKRAFQLLFLVILLLPLFFINVRNSHDWGGDFAQYIQQSINIAENKPQWKTGYIFNNQNPYLGPPSYPVGFPILLVPPYVLAGNKIISFLYYISFLLCCFAVIVFLFFRQKFNFLISLFAVLILVYNPWTLMFKSEILSDIPFALFFSMAILLYLKFKKTEKSKWLYAIFTGITIGFAMLIKSVGVVVLVGILLEILIKGVKNYYLNKTILKKAFLHTGIILLSCILFYFVVDKIIFPTKNDYFVFFSALFDFKNWSTTVLSTSNYYIIKLQEFFHQNNGKWNFVPLITKSFVLAFFIIGLLIQILKKARFLEFVILLYLLIILSFPNTSQGFRYLLPIAALIIYYAIIGLKSIQFPLKISRNYIVIFIGLAILMQYKLGANKIISQQKNILKGPQQHQAIETFEFIKENTAQDAKIVFIKPRVLALYTRRKSYTNQTQDIVLIEKQYKDLGFDYLMTMADIRNVSMDEYIQKHENNLSIVFRNEKFVLYKSLHIKP